MKRNVLSLLFLFATLSCFAQHYVFYGITGSGGRYNVGLIYKYDPLIGKFDTLYSLNPLNGSYTWSGLTLANNGLLYGTTEQGGAKNCGTMFSFDRSTNKFLVLFNFDSIHNGVHGVNGNNIMQAKNGLLYGTREWGGAHDSGVLFSYNIKTGKDSVLINFNTKIGALPNRTVIEDTSTGYLYGTTLYGGANDMGVIYRYDPLTNKDTVVFNFDSVNRGAAWPKGNSLMQANNGLFYGMTNYGGDWYEYSQGTIFSFNPTTNKDSTLFRFTQTTGCAPFMSNLIQAKNGLLYGLTNAYGADNYGTLFSYDITANSVSVDVAFNGTDGNEITGDLVQDPANDNLYGISNNGGSNSMGVLFCYEILNGKDSVLINFTGINGSYPLREPTLVKDTTTGISEVKTNNAGVRVYPNPNNGKFTIQLSGVSDKPVIEIYDVLGELIYSIHLNETTKINLIDRANGVYLYKIVSQKGGLISTGKLLVQ